MKNILIITVILFILILLFLPAFVYPQVKLSSLTRTYTPADSALFLLSQDSLGTTVSKSVTLGDLGSAILNNIPEFTAATTISGSNYLYLNQSGNKRLSFQTLSDAIDDSIGGYDEIVLKTIGTTNTLKGTYTLDGNSTLNSVGTVNFSIAKFLLPATTSFTDWRDFRVAGSDGSSLLTFNYGTSLRDTIPTYRWFRNDFDGSTDLKPGSIIQDNLSTALQNWILASGGGTITNQPDDITIENVAVDELGVKWSWIDAVVDSVRADAQDYINDSLAVPKANIDSLFLAVGNVAVFNPTAIKDVLGYMNIQRVDIVGLGDSNELQGGHGWNHGFQYALTQYYPMYATGLIAQSEGNQSGSGTGYLYNRIGNVPSPFGATTGAPAELELFLDRNDMQPAYYSYVSTTVGTGIANGLALLSNCPIGITDSLTFRIYWGSFDSGTGYFRPYVRRESSPYNTLTNGDTILTNTGSFGMHYTDIGLSQDSARNYDVSMKLTQVELIGPAFFTYYFCHNPSRTSGYSYNTLNARGGQSARTMAVDLQNSPDSTLRHYFDIIRTRQGTNKKIVITINEGLNDRNETLTSVGTGAITDGDSPEAFKDNIQASIDRITALWTAQGWSLYELYFLVFVSHPTDDPNDAELTSYENISIDLSIENPRTSVVLLSKLTEEGEMLGGIWYASGGSDRNHLTQAGYENLAFKIITALK